MPAGKLNMGHMKNIFYHTPTGFLTPVVPEPTKLSGLLKSAGIRCRLPLTVFFCLAALLCFKTPPVKATIYDLPANGDDVIGEISKVIAKEEDTLLDIAREHGLGYNEIIAVNPDVDPWLPGEGTQVIIPTRFILPDTPRRGIIINLAEMRLYYYPPADESGVRKVMTHPLGIGKEGWSTPTGYSEIISKVEKPSWTVPASLLEEKRQEGIEDYPRVVPPGPDNPLGDFAMRLSLTRYLIHGTNQPYGVGRRVSHGCIRLYPEGIAELFANTATKTSVLIINQPFKTGTSVNTLYFEAHKPLDTATEEQQLEIRQMLWGLTAMVDKASQTATMDKVRSVAELKDGLPHVIIEDYQPSPSIVTGGWVLQIGAYTNLKVAAQWMDRIKGLDRPTSMVASVADGMCHLVVGPYNAKQKVLREREKLEKLTGIRGRVQRADREGLLADCYL